MKSSGKSHQNKEKAAIGLRERLLQGFTQARVDSKKIPQTFKSRHTEERADGPSAKHGMHAPNFGKRLTLLHTSQAGVMPGTVTNVRDKAGTETDKIPALRELTF